jgi:hypothetical protein
MRRGLARFRIAVLCAVLTFGIIAASPAAEPGPTYPVGIRQVEFADAHYGPRTLSMAVFYPAVTDDSSAKPFAMPFFTKLTLYKDAEIAFDGKKLPLIMLSHGRIVRMTTQATSITTSFGLRQKPQPSSAHRLQAAKPASRPAS